MLAVGVKWERASIVGIRNRKEGQVKGDGKYETQQTGTRAGTIKPQVGTRQERGRGKRHKRKSAPKAANKGKSNRASKQNKSG